MRPSLIFQTIFNPLSLSLSLNKKNILGPLAVEIVLLSCSPSIWGWLHIYLFSPEIMEYDRLIGVKTRQIFSWGDVPYY